MSQQPDGSPDPYGVIALIAIDTEFRNRITGAVVKEKIAHDPEKWVWDRRWEFGAQPGWAAAVQYYMTSTSQTTGWQNDSSVISDAMILAAVNHIRLTFPQ